MKKSSPPCRIGSVLKKAARLLPRRDKAGNSRTPGAGAFHAAFFVRAVQLGQTPGAGKYRRSGRPDAFIIAKATSDS